MAQFVVQAVDHIDQTKPVVEAATTIGSVVAERLAAGDSVIVALGGVRGVSSSFFNVILDAAYAVLGKDIGAGRISVQTDTQTQRDVFARSLRAFMNRA